MVLREIITRSTFLSLTNSFTDSKQIISKAAMILQAGVERLIILLFHKQQTRDKATGAVHLQRLDSRDLQINPVIAVALKINAIKIQSICLVYYSINYGETGLYKNNAITILTTLLSMSFS